MRPWLLQAANDDAVFIGTFPGSLVNTTALAREDGRVLWGTQTTYWGTSQLFQSFEVLSGGTKVLSSSSEGR